MPAHNISDFTKGICKGGICPTYLNHLGHMSLCPIARHASAFSSNWQFWPYILFLRLIRYIFPLDHVDKLISNHFYPVYDMLSIIQYIICLSIIPFHARMDFMRAALVCVWRAFVKFSGERGSAVNFPHQFSYPENSDQRSRDLWKSVNPKLFIHHEGNCTYSGRL